MLVIRSLSRLITSNRADSHVPCLRKAIASVLIVRGHAALVRRSSVYMLHGFR